MPTTEQRPLKVLTESYRAHAANFNQTCRDLQRMGVRLHCIDLIGNRLAIDPKAGRRLAQESLVVSPTHRTTAGSTVYSAKFQGVTLEWREPISYERPEEWRSAQTH